MAEANTGQDLPTDEKVKYETTLTFIWQIDDFMRVTNGGKDAMYSPLFDDILKCKHKWQVRICPKKSNARLDHLSIHLYLMHLDPAGCQPEHPQYVAARFQLSLVDSDGNQTRCVGGRNTDPLHFHNTSGWGYDYWLWTNALNANPAHYLHNGNLVIRCQIWIEGSSKQKPSESKLPSREANLERMVTDFGNMLWQETLSDVSILVGSTTIRAHKCILASRSSVFQAMFSSGTYREIMESMVKIEDFEEDVIKAMLEFIYTGGVTPGLLKERAVDILIIADKYDIQGLKELADHSVGDHVSVDNALQILWLAERHGCNMLKEHVLTFLKRHLREVAGSETAQEFLQTNPQAVIELFISHIQ